MIAQLSNSNIMVGNRLILKDVSLELSETDFVFLSGENGSGKTVLLHTLLGLNRVTSGQQNINYNKNETVYIPDVAFFMDDDTVKMIVKILARFYRTTVKEIVQILANLDFDYISYQNHKSAELSKGSRQKLQIVPLFISNQSLYILDEIYAGLDASRQQLVTKRLVELASQGKTVLLVEHTLDLVNQIKSQIDHYQEWRIANQEVIVQ